MEIPFGYPRRSLEGTFATFRLGASWATKVAPGDLVELVDSRTSKKLLKLATVVSVTTGQLDQMAKLHAHSAHNWKNHSEAERPGLLVASLTKRYPPGRVSESSVVSVIYLQENSNDP